MHTRPTHLLAAAILLAALTLAPSQADAFCGFYVSGASGALTNDATMTVMMRDGMRTVLSMQNTYQGPPEDFALVIPVPVILKEKDVKTLPHDVFARVNAMASPRLVEYWEQDPCYQPRYKYKGKLGAADGFGRGAGLGSRAEDAKKAPVRVEAQFAVGEYEIVILSADDSSALDTWLRDNRYNIPRGAEAVLQPYIQQGMYFFVAKVDLDKVKRADGRAQLSPLRFHYDTSTFSLPIRLGLLNADGPQDLLIHILAPDKRFEVANYPNATLPTNLDVANHVRKSFPAFVNALFDKTQQKHPGAVVTEYAWAASSCDPCPGPTLNSRDFALLGADVIPRANSSNLVLTRLHARYTPQQATEDLVFRAAEPIQGGRERYVDTHELEQGAQPARINNFQARYIIRHLWYGPIACANPERGIWGGPPGHLERDASATPSTQSAFASRRFPSLERTLRSHVPELDLRAPWTIQGALKTPR